MKISTVVFFIFLIFDGSAFAQEWKEFCKNDQKICSYAEGSILRPSKDKPAENVKLDVRIVFLKENRVYDEQWEVNCLKREVSAGVSSKTSPSAFSRLTLYPDLNNLYEILCPDR